MRCRLTCSIVNCYITIKTVHCVNPLKNLQRFKPIARTDVCEILCLMLKVFIKMIYIIIPMILYSIPTMILGFNITGGNFQKNRHMDSHVIIAKDKIGPKMCIKDCIAYKGCNGVNYIRDGITCEMLSISYPDDKLLYRNGEYFTNISGWTQVTTKCFVTTYYLKNYLIMLHHYFGFVNVCDSHFVYIAIIFFF